VRQPLSVLLVVVLAGTLAGAQGAAPGAEVPNWHRDLLEYLSRGSGRWTADNAAYQSAVEPVTEYVLEFGLSFDGESMFGRFYGQEDGRRDVTRWEYRAYWDASSASSVMLQFGWGGGSGVGAYVPDGDNIFRFRQTVSTPGLPPRVEEQRITLRDENTFEMEAWGIDARGQRVPTRSYTYLRDPLF
jgi:predicted NUDIX family NTP pyrophosphohydrolase